MGLSSPVMCEKKTFKNDLSKTRIIQTQSIEIEEGEISSTNNESNSEETTEEGVQQEDSSPSEEPPSSSENETEITKPSNNETEFLEKVIVIIEYFKLISQELYSV